MANYYDDPNWRDRIKKIPLIDWEDQNFRKIINTVFDFSLEVNKSVSCNKVLAEFKDKIVFFDQNWDPMPKYFDNLSLPLKLLLHNPYKKT